MKNISFKLKFSRFKHIMFKFILKNIDSEIFFKMKRISIPLSTLIRRSLSKVIWNLHL